MSIVALLFLTMIAVMFQPGSFFATPQYNGRCHTFLNTGESKDEHGERRVDVVSIPLPEFIKYFKDTTATLNGKVDTNEIVRIKDNEVLVGKIDANEIVRIKDNEVLVGRIDANEKVRIKDNEVLVGRIDDLGKKIDANEKVRIKDNGILGREIDDLGKKVEILENKIDENEKARKDDAKALDSKLNTGRAILVGLTAFMAGKDVLPF